VTATVTVTVPATSAGSRSSVVLASLMLGTFTTGSAELLPVGLLPMIAADLGVSVAAAGTLVGAFALGLAVGGPLLTALTIRVDRRRVLVGSLVLFAVLVVSPAVVPHFGWYVVARMGAGALQGVFLAAAFTTATAVVPPARSGRAVSVVIAGFAFSTLVGLPLGVVLGSALGWRAALLAVGGSALLTALVVQVVGPPLPGSGRMRMAQLREALSSRVLAMLGLTLVIFAAPAAVMTYLVPVLERVIGLSSASATAVLVGYGAACVVGSFLGGRWADSGAARALVVATIGLTASFVLLYTARSQPLIAIVAIVSWAVLSSSAPPSVQHRTVSLAGAGGALAASLPASAASAGIAVGSTASGIAYAASGPAAVIVTGALIAFVAVALAVATRRLRPPADKNHDQTCDRTCLADSASPAAPRTDHVLAC